MFWLTNNQTFAAVVGALFGFLLTLVANYYFGFNYSKYECNIARSDAALLGEKLKVMNDAWQFMIDQAVNMSVNSEQAQLHQGKLDGLALAKNNAAKSLEEIVGPIVAACTQKSQV